MEATAQNTQFDLGHWVLRLIALVIDGIILYIVGAILFFALLLPLDALLLPLVVGVLMLIYFLFMDVNWGGTLGKRILGLRVQTVNGGRINYSQSVIRNISKIHPLLILLDWVVGIATPGDRRQKYTDRIAGVVVVQTQSFAAVAPPPASPPPAS